jgi:hypothetical protein
MSADRTKDYNAQPVDQNKDRKGGTQPGDVSRLIDPDPMTGGTPAVTSPAGGTHPARPSQAVPNTDIAGDRPATGNR